jgi:hypothetical protein
VPESVPPPEPHPVTVGLHLCWSAGGSRVGWPFRCGPELGAGVREAGLLPRAECNRTHQCLHKGHLVRRLNGVDKRCRGD